MPAKPEKTRRRDMWRAIPWKRRAEIERKIKQMPGGDRIPTEIISA